MQLARLTEFCQAFIAYNIDIPMCFHFVGYFLSDYMDNVCRHMRRSGSVAFRRRSSLLSSDDAQEPPVEHRTVVTPQPKITVRIVFYHLSVCD